MNKEINDKHVRQELTDQDINEEILVSRFLDEIAYMHAIRK